MSYRRLPSFLVQEITPSFRAIFIFLLPHPVAAETLLALTHFGPGCCRRNLLKMNEMIFSKNVVAKRVIP